MNLIIQLLLYALGSVIGFFLLCILGYIFTRIIMVAIITSIHEHQNKRREENGAKIEERKRKG